MVKNSLKVCKSPCREWKSPTRHYVCPSYENCSQRGKKIVVSLTRVSG